MSTFQEKVKQQIELQKDIEKLWSNFKKEPKRSLKKVARVNEWYNLLNEIWDRFRMAHDELSTHDSEFIASDYFGKREFEKKANYEAMKAKIKKVLQNLQVSPQEVSDQSQDENEQQNDEPEPNEQSVQSEASDEQSESDQEVTESDQDVESPSQNERMDVFKTPKGRRFPKKSKYGNNIRLPAI